MRMDTGKPEAPIVPAPEIMKAMADAYVKANTGKGLTARQSMEAAVGALSLGLQKRGHYEAASLIATVVMGWEFRNEVTR
jgi:hypothetical protein